LLYLTNPNSKNVDSLTITLLNVYLGYDNLGYDLPYVSWVLVGEKEKLV